MNFRSGIGNNRVSVAFFICLFVQLGENHLNWNCEAKTLSRLKAVLYHRCAEFYMVCKKLSNYH